MSARILVWNHLGVEGWIQAALGRLNIECLGRLLYVLFWSGPFRTEQNHIPNKRANVSQYSFAEQNHIWGSSQVHQFCSLIPTPQISYHPKDGRIGYIWLFYFAFVMNLSPVWASLWHSSSCFKLFWYSDSHVWIQCLHLEAIEQNKHSCSD